MSKKILAFLLFSACAFAQSTTTVTGNLKNLGTGSVSSNSFVRFYLRGCAGNQPRINGTAIIAPTQGNVYYFDFVPNGSGAISGTLYSTRDAAGTGNGAIECGGSFIAVWYGLVPFVNGKAGPETPVHAKASATLDISNVTAISTTPVVTAPTGDTTYMRLDAGNSPATGAWTFNSNVTVGGTLGAQSYNNIQTINSSTAGADICAKIATAIGLLPSTGGTVDARGIQGAQTCAADPFSGVTKPVQLLIGATTITTSACWGMSNNATIIGSGRGISTLKLANGVNNCYVIQNADPTNGNHHLYVTGMTIDGNALNQSPTGAQRTGTIFWQKVTNGWIVDNELKNAYNYHVELFTQSQFIWVTNNKIDGSNNGSGVLTGNGPGANSEAYDIFVQHNSLSNIGGGDCLFSTGSNSGAGTYGTARIHFNDNTLFNCADVAIEVGDSTQNSEANNNIINIAPAVTISSISRTSNVVTATVTCTWTSDMGCLTAFTKTGSPFTVAGVTDASFNGTAFTVTSANLATNTLTYAQTAANASSSGGTITRQGNLALLSRASQNIDFHGNVVNGNGALSNDCEMAWRQTGDNASNSRNISFDNVCNNTGRNGFSITSGNAGDVTQVQTKSKYFNTTGSDFVIGSLGTKIRIMSGGFLTAGAPPSIVGTSFNQVDDLKFFPGSGNTARFIFSATNLGLGLSNADFTPNTLLHIQSQSGGRDVTIQQLGDANAGILLQNSAQSWGIDLRQSSSEAFILRDITGFVDAFQLAKVSGNWTFLGKPVSSSGLTLADLGFPHIVGTPQHVTGQTANIAATNLVASAPVGTYFLRANCRTTTSGTGTTATISFLWTDEGGAKTSTSATWALNSVTISGYVYTTQMIHANAASNIQYSVTGTFGTSVYACDAVAVREN